MLMRYASIAALRKVRFGLRLIFWRYIALALYYIFFNVLLGYQVLIPGTTWYFVAEYGVSIFLSLVMLVALIQSTTELTCMPQAETVRQIRGWMMILFVFDWVFTLVSSVLDELTTDSTYGAVFFVNTAVFFSLFVALETLKLKYFRRLSLLAPDWKLAHRFCLLSRFALLGPIVFVIGFFAFMVYEPDIARDPDSVTANSPGLTWVYFLFIMIAYACYFAGYFVPLLVYIYKLGNRVEKAYGYSSQAAFAASYGSAASDDK